RLQRRRPPRTTATCAGRSVEACGPGARLRLLRLRSGGISRATPLLECRRGDSLARLSRRAAPGGQGDRAARRPHADVSWRPPRDRRGYPGPGRPRPLGPRSSPPAPLSRAAPLRPGPPRRDRSLLASPDPGPDGGPTAGSSSEEARGPENPGLEIASPKFSGYVFHLARFFFASTWIA